MLSFFYFRGIQLRRDRNPTQYMVRTNENKTAFLLFFSDLSSSSDYGVTVIPHSKWFEQTKNKSSFLLFFSTSELCFQLRRDRNPTQYMVRANKKKHTHLFCFFFQFGLFLRTI